MNNIRIETEHRRRRIPISLMIVRAKIADAARRAGLLPEEPRDEIARIFKAALRRPTK